MGLRRGRAAAGRADHGRAAGASGGHHRPGRRLPGDARHAGPGPDHGHPVRCRPRRSRDAAGGGRVGRDPARPRPCPHRHRGARDSADWRITWYQGLRELASGHPGEAQAAFDAVYDALPGELPPQLALGFAAEAAGDHATAARYFERVWMVDRSYVSAAFGLARAKLAADDRPGAIAALAAVPLTSSHHVVAQVAAVRINLTRTGQSGAGFGELREAAGRLERLPLDAARRQQLTSEILQAALDGVTAGQPAGGGRLLGCEPAEHPLRSGLEQSYRALARLAPDQARRIELVDQANEVRPRTWL